MNTATTHGIVRQLIAGALCTLSACSGDSGSLPSGPTGPAPSPPAPPLGDLHVSIATSGEDPDPDGYTLTLDGSDSRSVGPQDAVTFADLPPGSHSLELKGLAYNCEAGDGNAQAVHIAPGGTAEAAFRVDCAFIAGELDLEIAENVPQGEAALVRESLDLAQRYLEASLGGGIPRRVRDTIPALIVATGRGNEEPGGGGACCTALSTTSSGTPIVRLFFDVAHPQWIDRPAGITWARRHDRRASVIREYARGWRHEIGCSGQARTLGGWLAEGIDQWIGYRALIAEGAMSSDDVLDFMLRAAKATGQLARPLSAFEPADSEPSPGHVGYLAVDRLVHTAPGGQLALRRICEAAAEGEDLERAFRAAFGISLPAFYADFDPGVRSDGGDGAPPGISLGALSGLDSSDADFVRFTLSGSVVDRNGDGSAVTSAVVLVTVDPNGSGACPGPLADQEDNGVSPSDAPATEPVSVDVTEQVKTDGGRWTIAFRAENLSDLAGLGDVTYCFEVVADDGARRKDGSDDGLVASAFVAKDFTWR